MSYETSFNLIALEDLVSVAEQRRADGWRYVQTLAVNTEAGVDLVYSFMKGSQLENLTIKAVGKSDVVKSITDIYLAAFVWENEINDLFGVRFDGIAIDFAGAFYGLSQSEPMTVISPAQLAAREKAKKIAAAKAAKEAAAKEPAPSEENAADADAEFEAKLAAMDPEKAAKVRAAMEAKAKKEAAKAAAAKDAEMEAKLAAMDPEKAAKVRAAMAAKAAKEAAKKEGE